MSISGAPFHVPALFRKIPEVLQKVDAPATEDEISEANTVRRRFELDSWQDPYMVDICRAFRLAEGARVYIEVGTRDKGNLAWLAPRLAPGATMIDIDIDKFDESERRLRDELTNIDYHVVTGDSISQTTLNSVTDILDGRNVDLIFCDSSHMFAHTLSEFDRYFPLLRPGGILMYHDCFFEGNDNCKGKMQAMQAIDQFIPVFCVYMNEPVHRYLPRPEKTDVWGGVSILIKQ